MTLDEPEAAGTGSAEDAGGLIRTTATSDLAVTGRKRPSPGPKPSGHGIHRRRILVQGVPWCMVAGVHFGAPLDERSGWMPR